MAKGMNLVVLKGNLTRDPEIKHTPSGTMLAEMRLAVSERKRDSSGNWTDYAHYFNVTVWGGKDGAPGQAGVAQRYLSKGSPVLIRGRLQWREWEQDGVKRQAVDVVADELVLIGDGRGSSGGGGGDFVPSGSDFPVPTDDDIPF